MNQSMNITEVLQEIGRLHLQVATLEKALAEATARIDELTPKAATPAPKSQKSAA